MTNFQELGILKSNIEEGKVDMLFGFYDVVRMYINSHNHCLISTHF